MFKVQGAFDLNKEEKILISSMDSDNELVKTLSKNLAINLDDYADKSSLTIHTLKKIKAAKVIFLNNEKVDKNEKLEEVFKPLKDLDDQSLVLLDTFSKESMETLAEKIATTRYKFMKYKSENKPPFVVHYTGETTKQARFEKGLTIGEAMNFTRDLVNTPYIDLNAEKLAAIAKDLETYDNVKVKILEKEECEAMSMGAFLGVNKGSKDAPKLIHITYTGNPDSLENTFFVGKGVMYDTGGYSLKTVQSMPTMKMDMGGAATVLGALKAIAALKYKYNVSVVIAATDNRIGDDAIVPDDILHAANGKSIEIISTDAEGRLTLADALWYAQKEGATRLIDVATLTGAVVGALGDDIVGAFTNKEEFYNTLSATAKKAAENVWLLPIGDAHRDSIKSIIADMKNSGGRLGGASIAAAFLENFVKADVPWIHLDIAGTAYKKESGATGVMVKTLTKLFE